MFRVLFFSVLLFGYSISASAGLQNGRLLCEVMDPTGTPLNVRTRPYGEILGALSNGTKVLTIGGAADYRGRMWVRVITIDKGKDGWVYRDFLDCSD